MAYNYTKAAKIFDDMFNLCCNPWTLSDDEKQQARRDFMRALTRGDADAIKSFIDFVTDEKTAVCSYETEKTRFYDFDMMREYDDIINAIKNFKN